MTGELDPNTPPASARFIADTIVGAEMHVIPDASHMVTLERPGAINDRLLHFLARFPFRRNRLNDKKSRQINNV